MADTPITYACRPGRPHSAFALDRAPTEGEWSVLAGAGLEPARLGACYRRTVRCPVNGDGYWYTRREILDSAGRVVGSVDVPSGARGVL